MTGTKTEKFASVEEAIEGAGTRTLSHLGSNPAHVTRILTVEEVKTHDLETGSAGPLREGEHRANVSPYRETLDGRNFWTARQETADTQLPDLPPEGGGIPDVPPVLLDPTGYSFGATGGSGSFGVTVTGEGQSGTWTVDKQAEATWLQLVSPPLHEPQATTTGTVSYTVDPNTTGQPRQGHFYVNGKTFTVDVAAA